MVFQPPAASSNLVAGIAFAAAVDFRPDIKARFDAFDATGSPDDPNMCKALQIFPHNQAIFWSAKMAICADGPAAGPGHRTGSQMDPDAGQDGTAFDLTPDGSSGDQYLPSETIFYIVLPCIAKGVEKPFDKLLAVGDVAIVVYGDKMVPAICGDTGPFNLIGEASIAVHAALDVDDPCAKRDPNGNCHTIRDSSVAEDVLFFVFPGSAIRPGEVTLAGLNTYVAKRALALFAALKNAPSV